MQFRMSSNNFARLCEVENSSAPFSPSWSISHDCAGFSHSHAKSVFTFPLWAAAKFPSSPFRTIVRIFHMFMQNWKTCFFNSFLPFLSLDFTSTNSKSTPNLGPNQLHYFFHYALDHHQLYLFSSIWFISFITNLSKSYLEMTPKLHKTC